MALRWVLAVFLSSISAVRGNAPTTSADSTNTCFSGGGDYEGYFYGDYHIPVCWLTYLDSNDPRASMGAIQQEKCPDGISLDWTLEPPKNGMVENTEYAARANFSLDKNETGLFSSVGQLVKNNGVDFPHVNIHSCSSKVSFCTPTLAHDGNLATHTAAESGDADDSGTFVLESEVLLPEGTFTIIAHARFFTTSNVKVDVAKAIKRTVLDESSVGDSKGYHLGEFDTPICWKTFTDPDHHRYGETVQLNECPPNVNLDWTSEPPSQGMVAGGSYPVTANLTLGTNDAPQQVGSANNLLPVLKDTNHVPHFNIHSCYSSVAFCTPMVANDGTLSTHTQAIAGDLDSSGSIVLDSVVQLDDEGAYTIIAHARFFVEGIKYDVAKAIKRTVLDEASVGDSRGYHLGDFDVGICWKTYTDPQHYRYGETVQLNECPPNVNLQWISEPPSQDMVEKTSYAVEAKLSLGTKDAPLQIGSANSLLPVLKDTNHVPHFNIHSCYSSVAFCTPMIANDGSLSTHTQAVAGDLDGNGEMILQSNVQLTAESYTIIAHARFFVKGIKYDVAAAIKRTVKAVPVCLKDDFYFTVPMQCDSSTLRRKVNFSWYQPKVCNGGLQLPDSFDIECDYLPSDAFEATLSTIIIIFSVMCNAILLLWLMKNWGSPRVKASQPGFSSLLLFAACVHSAVSVALIGENTDSACMSRPWLMHITFNMVIGVLCLQCARIMRILRGAERYRIDDLTTAEATKLFCFHMAFVAASLLVSTVANKDVLAATVLNSTRQGIDNIPRTICEGGFVMFNSLLIFYECALVLFSAYASYSTWSILSNPKNRAMFKINMKKTAFTYILADSRRLMFAIYTVAMIDGLVLLGTEVLLVDSISSTTKTVLYLLCLNGTQLIAMCIIFVPKLLDSSNSQSRQKIYADETSDSQMAPSFILGGANVDEVAAGSTLSVQIGDRVFKMVVKDKIYQDHEELPTRDMKLLLLGAGAVGKSTLFKQMRLLYCDGFDDKDRVWAKGAIIENVLELISDLDRMCEAIDIELDDEVGDMLDQVTSEHQKFKARDVNAEPPPVLIWDEIKSIWKDEGIQKAFNHYATGDEKDSFSTHILSHEYALYFMKKLPVLSTPGYRPSEEDILKLRRPTNDMESLEFSMTMGAANLNVTCNDVGGQVQERSIWSKLAKESNGIMFLMSIGEIDQVDAGGVNKFLSQVRLLDSICRSNIMQNKALVVVLNKFDLFEAKFPAFDPSAHFPSFSGSSNVKEVYEHLKGLVKSAVSASLDIEVQIVSCCATETSLAQNVVAGVITTVEKHVASALGA